MLLLDEPASGLDPRARIEIKELLKELKSMGKTIIISSHILPELADFCNKIGIIEQGELVVSGDVQAIMQQVSGGSPVRADRGGGPGGRHRIPDRAPRRPRRETSPTACSTSSTRATQHKFTNSSATCW